MALESSVYTASLCQVQNLILAIKSLLVAAALIIKIVARREYY